MKKGMIFLSFIIAAIIILTNVSSTVVSVDPKYVVNQDKKLVEMNRYGYHRKDTIVTEFTDEEIEYLKTCLIKLEDALFRNDDKEISKYEEILKEKGIFGEKHQNIGSDSLFSRLSPMQRLCPKPLNDNLSNQFCYVHAVGEGIMIFTIGAILAEILYNILSNASSVWELLALGLVLLPFYVLLFLVTHLIPFRILLPVGNIGVKNGTISTIGIDGFHTREIVDNMTELAVYGFTGITISLPGTNTTDEFLFASGFAFKAEET